MARNRKRYEKQFALSLYVVSELRIPQPFRVCLFPRTLNRRKRIPLPSESLNTEFSVLHKSRCHLLHFFTTLTTRELIPERKWNYVNHGAVDASSISAISNLKVRVCHMNHMVSSTLGCCSLKSFIRRNQFSWKLEFITNSRWVELSGDTLISSRKCIIFCYFRNKQQKKWKKKKSKQIDRIHSLIQILDGVPH